MPIWAFRLSTASRRRCSSFVRRSRTGTTAETLTEAQIPPLSRRGSLGLACCALAARLFINAASPLRRQPLCSTMYHMRTTIRRLGNSQGVSIPRSVLDEAGLAIDSPVEMTVDGSSIVLRKIAVHPREGWAEDAALVVDGPEDKEWLDADLDGKSRSELTW